MLFFIKPKEVSVEELTEEEKPNPLEQVLKTDSVEEIEKIKDEKEDDGEGEEK